MILQSNFVGLT